MSDQMQWLLITDGGLIAFATVVLVYDRLAKRQHRRKREQQRRSA